MEVKRVFKCMHNTMDYTIYDRGELEENKENNVHGFVDFEWVGDSDRRWLTNGYLFKIFNEAVSWMRIKKSIISLLIIEARYTTHECKEVAWLQRLCSNFGFEDHAVRLECAKQRKIFVPKNPTYHSNKIS